MNTQETTEECSIYDYCNMVLGNKDNINDFQWTSMDFNSIEKGLLRTYFDEVNTCDRTKNQTEHLKYQNIKNIIIPVRNCTLRMSYINGIIHHTPACLLIWKK